MLWLMSESLAEATPPVPSAASRLIAEALGTFLLVFGGVGTALFTSTHFTDPGSGSAVYVAFGLTVVVGVYAFGPISGGHFNPAVSMGLAAAGRLPWRDVPGYIIAQVVGGVIASTALVLIGLFGPDGWLTATQDAGFASNGW